MKRRAKAATVKSRSAWVSSDRSAKYSRASSRRQVTRWSRVVSESQLYRLAARRNCSQNTFHSPDPLKVGSWTLGWLDGMDEAPTLWLVKSGKALGWFLAVITEMLWGGCLEEGRATSLIASEEWTTWGILTPALAGQADLLSVSSGSHAWVDDSGLGGWRWSSDTSGWSLPGDKGWGGWTLLASRR